MHSRLVVEVDVDVEFDVEVEVDVAEVWHQCRWSEAILVHSRGSMEAAGISTLQLAHCSRETVVPATKVSLDFLQVLALPANITANGNKTEDRNKSSRIQSLRGFQLSGNVNSRKLV